MPGVAEVASVGGVVRQYQIDVDPNRLRAFRIPFSAVVDAVMRSNRNVGGNVVEASGTWTVIRGLGLIERLSDIEQIVIGAENGIPIFVRQVAEVKIGDAFRASALVKGTEEAVGGVVVARYGVSTIDVINRVKAKITALEAGLPRGVRIVPFYDRSDLIARAVDTLKRALLEETLIVTLAHMVFLMHLRSVLIVTLPLPLAVLITFLAMRYLGISANIMSLAGIAIAIGVLVDAAIVVTENAFRFLEQRQVDARDRPAVAATVREATRLVGRPIFFSMAIILLAFLPVFALTGQEGKLFHPLAFTKTFAVAGATLLSVTLVPVLCTLLLGGRMHGESANPVMRPLVWLYRPLLRWALRHRVLTIGAAVLVFAGALSLVPHIGREFMPPAERGGPDVHAGHGSGHLAAAGHCHCAEAERGDPAVPGSGHGRRQDRPCGHLHGPGAAQHDRDRRAPQAGLPVAAGDDAGKAHWRAGCGHDDARRRQYLDAADYQSHQHAHHRAFARKWG